MRACLAIVLALLLAPLCAAQQPPPPADETPFSAEDHALFKAWSYGHLRGYRGMWRGDTMTLYTARLCADAPGQLSYHETLRHLSEDGQTLTTLTRSALCGTAGYTARGKSVQQAEAPYTFRRPDGSLEVWEVDAQTRELSRIVRKAGDAEELLWQAPAEPKKRKLVRFRSLKDDGGDDWAEDPSENPRYALSPDGQHMVYAFENASGAISYIFDIYTKDVEGWVEEKHQKYFGTGVAALDFALTDEGIWGILKDDELELRIALHFPYLGEDKVGLWYRSAPSEHRTPLVEAAIGGQVEVVRALLTSPRVDPGAVNTEGYDAAMLAEMAADAESMRSFLKQREPNIDAHDAEITALVRRARGPGYNRGAALDAAIDYWQGVHTGKIAAPPGNFGFTPNIIHRLRRAKEKWLAEQACALAEPFRFHLLLTRKRL